MINRAAVRNHLETGLVEREFVGDGPAIVHRHRDPFARWRFELFAARWWPHHDIRRTFNRLRIAHVHRDMGKTGYVGCVHLYCSRAIRRTSIRILRRLATILTRSVSVGIVIHRSWNLTRTGVLMAKPRLRAGRALRSVVCVTRTDYSDRCLGESAPCHQPFCYLRPATHPHPASSTMRVLLPKDQPCSESYDD